MGYPTPPIPGIPAGSTPGNQGPPICTSDVQRLFSGRGSDFTKVLGGCKPVAISGGAAAVVVSLPQLPAVVAVTLAVAVFALAATVARLLIEEQRHRHKIEILKLEHELVEAEQVQAPVAGDAGRQAALVGGLTEPRLPAPRPGAPRAI